MSQGYCNSEAMRNNGVEYHDVDDDTDPDPDDTSDDPTAATASDRLMAFGEQGSGCYGNADAA